MNPHDLRLEMVEIFSETVSPVISTTLTVVVNNYSFNLTEHPELYEAVREWQLILLSVILFTIIAATAVRPAFDTDPLFKSKRHTLLAIIFAAFSLPFYHLNWVIIDSFGTQIVQTPSELSAESIQMSLEAGLQLSPLLVVVLSLFVFTNVLIILGLSGMYILLIITGAILVPVFAIQSTLKPRWNLDATSQAVTETGMLFVGTWVGVYASLQVISSSLISSGSIELLLFLSVMPIVSIFLGAVCEELYVLLKTKRIEAETTETEPSKTTNPDEFA